MKSKRACLCLVVSFMAGLTVIAQVPSAGKPYVLTERSDFSKYVDGKYIGHVYREVRSRVEADRLADGSSRYTGDAFLLEETLRDMRAAARSLDDVVRISFTVRPSGTVEYPSGSKDPGLPAYRGFPSGLPSDIQNGQRWQLPAVYVVQPDRDAQATRIPVLVEYEYAGATEYRGSPAVAVKAKFAARYRGTDRAGDPALRESSGSHDADIVLDAQTGAPLFVRDRIDERFTYSDGRIIRFAGFTLLFFESAPPPERGKVADLLAGKPSPVPDKPSGVPAGTTSGAVVAATGDGTGNIASGGTAGPTIPTDTKPIQPIQPITIPKGVQPGGIEIAETERGVMLILFDLRFKPDSPELLAGEESRLDYVARALGTIPERTFLVEGHTAEVGNPTGQLALSMERAKKIVVELAKRGIPENRFVYRGLGATKPVASNANEAGKARNRRVEITVLDF